MLDTFSRGSLTSASVTFSLPCMENHLKAASAPDPAAAQSTAGSLTSLPLGETPQAQSASETANWQTYLTFLLPFVVYMVVGSLEPTPPDPAAPSDDRGWWTLSYRLYPVIYTLKLGLTLACVILVSPGYRQFPLRLSGWWPVVGGLGAVAWVALAELQRPWNPILGMPERSSFNPLVELADQPTLAYLFFAVRLLGLVVVVPIIEEFFLRAFVMRIVADAHWWRLPLTQITRAGLIAGTIVPMLTHPGEALAAAVWFSAVTWMMLRTGSIWDCIAAHALTNLLLGVYVVGWSRWFLM